MRVDQNMAGQDFSIGFNGASATSHVFNRANGNSLEPRVARMLGRLNVVQSTQSTARSLLKTLAISGYNLVLNPGPGTTTNGTAASPGFPGLALAPTALVDQANLIGCAAGPNSPVELQVDYSAATVIAGSIGTDLPEAALLPEILDALEEGDLYGEPNFALGGGEISQANPNTAETVSIAFKPPRAMRLERMVVEVFRSDNAAVIPADFTMSKFDIAGNPMLATSSGMDCLLLGSTASDEDGLQVNQRVESDDLIEIDVAVAALGAAVSGIFQVGWFTS